jgi:hypothetical protein
LRGGLFSSENSSTWQYNFISGPNKDYYDMNVDTQLGYHDFAYQGFDMVSLAGAGGPSIAQNVSVGMFFPTNDSYLGLFGLDPTPSNFATFTGDPKSLQFPSYLQQLQNQSLIPSLSWGYTAGNPYRKA